MNPDLELCAHLGGDGFEECAFEARDLLDWYDGPVAAVVRCLDCPGRALVQLIDWSRSHVVRVFSLAALSGEAHETYLRNVDKGSCDPGRLTLEREALVASAGPACRIVAIDVDSHAVVASAPRAPSLAIPIGTWQERLPPEEDPSWFKALGLEKRTGDGAGLAAPPRRGE